MKNELKSLSSGKEIIMTNIELKKLVERAKKKDNNAMEALYKEYYKDVLYVCSRYNMNPQDAEDITQDSFVTAFSSLSSLEDEEKFGSWISRIASNKCLNLLNEIMYLQWKVSMMMKMSLNYHQKIKIQRM